MNTICLQNCQSNHLRHSKKKELGKRINQRLTGPVNRCSMFESKTEIISQISQIEMSYTPKPQIYMNVLHSKLQSNNDATIEVYMQNGLGSILQINCSGDMQQNHARAPQISPFCRTYADDAKVWSAGTPVTRQNQVALRNVKSSKSAHDKVLATQLYDSVTDTNDCITAPIILLCSYGVHYITRLAP